MIESIEISQSESVREGERGYEEYQALGGVLNPGEFQRILKRVAEASPASSDSSRSTYADSLARAVGITLSREVVTIYGILSEERAGLAKSRKNEMSDQELLAEALRMAGDTPSLSALMEEYPGLDNNVI